MAREPQTSLEDIRPIVGSRSTNRGVWLFGALLALVAIGLFSALEARRSAISSPRTAAGPGILADRSAGAIEPVPPLVIPEAQPYAGDAFVRPPSVARAPEPFYPTLPGVPRSPRTEQPRFIPGPPVGPAPVYAGAPPDFRAMPAPEPAEALPAGGLAGGRVGATRFASPSTTVPQGTIVLAVLETALDSNRPGLVRAIVSRDVRGFDGSRVLIPRGSRLFGEYKADLADGQNRALVQWLRLTRPDGVQIALDSPSADALGRAGVRGKVDSHFFQRFAGAILQSALDVGVGVATRSASKDTVIVGLPGSNQNLVTQQNTPVRPTLRVRHGASVSVFVARDLDFTAVEQ